MNKLSTILTSVDGKLDKQFRDDSGKIPAFLIPIREGCKVFIHSHQQELIAAWVEMIDEVVKTKRYKAMVENGDLSFLAYTPTEIYLKALNDLKSTLQDSIQGV